MFFIIIVLLIVALIIALLILGKASLTLSILQNRLTIRAHALGINFLRKDFVVRRKIGEIVEFCEVTKNGEEPLSSVTELFAGFKRGNKNDSAAHEAIRYVFAKGSIDIDVKIKYGLGDAFSTAMLGGLINIIMGAVHAVMKRKKVNVAFKMNPQFSPKQSFSFKADCIIALSPVNIMIGYMIYKKILRR